VLYIITLQSVENHLKKKYTREIENRYLGDTGRLLDGSTRLKDAVNENIDRYLNEKNPITFGLVLNITITTKMGTILYPAVFSQEQDSPITQDPTSVAAENYALLNEGLRLTMDTKIEYLAILPIVLLAAFIFVSLMILYLHYRSATVKLNKEDFEREKQIRNLLNQEAQTARQLEKINQDRARLTAEFQRLKDVLKDEQTKASRDEDELIEEIDSLEKQLDENLNLQLEQQEEIESLKEQIQQFEKEKSKGEKQKAKATQAAGKRFNALYKNISITNRAVGGFIDLNEDLKIKAEETIHQLNENPDSVLIKRKVFVGKRDRKTVLEVIFGYKGRLYYRNLKDSGIEILAIGTKNTQARELEYLNRIQF
jgi:flagellar motility protein MotE (MotC chaperone)